MDPYYNKQVMLGNRALSILSQENYPVEDKPTIINYRQPSEVDEDTEDDYGVVGYMGEDDDIEQAKYDVMSMLSDQFTGFDNRIDSMKQKLDDINNNINSQSSIIQGIHDEIYSESSIIQGIQEEIYSESSMIQGEIYSESSMIQEDIITILEQYSRGQVCSPPCSPPHICLSNSCFDISSLPHSHQGPAPGPTPGPTPGHTPSNPPNHSHHDPCASAPCPSSSPFCIKSSTNPLGYICQAPIVPVPGQAPETSTGISNHRSVWVGVVVVAVVLLVVRYIQIYLTAREIDATGVVAVGWRTAYTNWPRDTPRSGMLILNKGPVGPATLVLWVILIAVIIIFQGIIAYKNCAAANAATGGRWGVIEAIILFITAIIILFTHYTTIQYYYEPVPWGRLVMLFVFIVFSIWTISPYEALLPPTIKGFSTWACSE